MPLVRLAAQLAYTPVGGDVLYVEAETMGGRGELILTGQLGDVMVESVKIAQAWVRAHAVELGLSTSGGRHFLNASDLHIHFPSGAMPKDGPSAGVTITTAIVSLLTGRLVRPDLAMTGEVTLRGLVLPVGGIKEKLIAAHRAGMRTVLVPAKNEKDLGELPATVRAGLNVTLVRDIDEVLAAALQPTATMTDVTPTPTEPSQEDDGSAGGSGGARERHEVPTPMPLPLPSARLRGGQASLSSRASAVLSAVLSAAPAALSAAPAAPASAPGFRGQRLGMRSRSPGGMPTRRAIDGQSILH